MSDKYDFEGANNTLDVQIEGRLPIGQHVSASELPALILIEDASHHKFQELKIEHLYIFHGQQRKIPQMGCGSWDGKNTG